MYSAIKVDGKKLYELARAGIEIERQPRRVVIHDIEIKEINLPYVHFSVSCGKGTYIRSLCRDIGDKLGCGGIMDSLVRSSVNSDKTGVSFFLEDSIKLDDIESFTKEGKIEGYILTIDKMFPNMEKTIVTDEGDRLLKNGNVLKVKDFCKNGDYVIPKETEGKEYLVYDREGSFTAIYEYKKSVEGFKAIKMFL
jgi:tRNA pseudouridine55 synthase